MTTDKNDKVLGYAPWNYPNLIICGRYAMVKNNGMPYTYPVDENNWWPFFTSSSYNPTKIFLELIWTRLSYKYKLPNTIFGEDLLEEPHNHYLDCRVQIKDEPVGWEYNHFTVPDDDLKKNIHARNWSPVFLDLPQFMFIQRLCNTDIDIEKEVSLQSFVQSNGYDSLRSFIESLKKTGLIYVENGVARLLTQRCRCAVLPDGRFVAAENKSGKLTRWLMKQSQTKSPTIGT